MVCHLGERTPPKNISVRVSVLGLVIAAISLIPSFHMNAPPHRMSDLFEPAVDALIAGDVDAITRLIDNQPTLVTARSTRPHGATLLHYVSANGVEDERQRTPANIIALATLLLDAGADVNATANVYGGGATTLALTVTSAHPRAAGVQLGLAALLLERDATIDRDIVSNCLANGCPEAAAFMAEHMLARGDTLRLDEAAGIGRIDIVASLLPHIDSDDAVLGEAMQQATWYDQRAVLTLLLEHGVPVDVRAPRGGATALHVAAYLGNVALVELLLQHGANPLAVDAIWKTTPLVWAQHAHQVEHRGPAEAYQAVMRRLVHSAA